MVEGKYIWKSENVGKSHLKCQNKCATLMREKVEKIIIANTSTTEKELKPYYDLAIAYGYKVFSIIVENRISSKNIHNVPEETIMNMRKKFNIKL
jgi:NEDD4-binding protein 2